MPFRDPGISVDAICTNATTDPAATPPRKFAMPRIDQLTLTASRPMVWATIALILAYDDPNIVSDLHQFDLQYGIPDPPISRS